MSNHKPPPQQQLGAVLNGGDGHQQVPPWRNNEGILREIQEFGDRFNLAPGWDPEAMGVAPNSGFTSKQIDIGEQAMLKQGLLTDNLALAGDNHQSSEKQPDNMPALMGDMRSSTGGPSWFTFEEFKEIVNQELQSKDIKRRFFSRNYLTTKRLKAGYNELLVRWHDWDPLALAATFKAMLYAEKATGAGQKEVLEYEADGLGIAVTRLTLGEVDAKWAAVAHCLRSHAFAMDPAAPVFAAPSTNAAAPAPGARPKRQFGGKAVTFKAPRRETVGKRSIVDMQSLGKKFDPAVQVYGDGIILLLVLIIGRNTWKRWPRWLNQAQIVMLSKAPNGIQFGQMGRHVAPVVAKVMQEHSILDDLTNGFRTQLEDITVHGGVHPFAMDPTERMGLQEAAETEMASKKGKNKTDDGNEEREGASDDGNEDMKLMDRDLYTGIFMN